MTTLHPKLRQLQKQFAESPLVQVDDDLFHACGVELWIKRDDLLHPIISGNKWRKLKYILDHALKLGADTVVSMGGAYSNHLHALAFVGKWLGLKTIAYVRGERPEALNPTLADLLDWGMDLRFVSRVDYRRLRAYRAHDSFPGLKSGQYWLPEGGAAELALKGVADIVREIDIEFDVLFTACGTGTTLAGLIQAAPPQTKLIGVAALKGAEFLKADVSQMRFESNCPEREWTILLDYHFGGFAKKTAELLEFMQAFQAGHAIPVEPVYTAKALYAVYDLLQKGCFKSGQRIVVLHTGGLQGSR
ncbi:1-aminocyclopropane-1-carboxylate deaminase/D-cysteine desulfhydrase [Methylomonas sp. MgM2]